MKKTYVSYAGTGVDVASQRADDLDRLCLEHIGAKSSARVLDLGAGAGGQSARMAGVGAEVLAVDIHDFQTVFAEHRATCGIPKAKLQFFQGDISDFPAPWLTAGVTDVVIQRTIHYLRYQEALQLLSCLQENVQDKLFISVTGIASAVGTDYAGCGVALQERFFRLALEPAQTFSIAQPVCLYSKEEFVSLLGSAGWHVEACWESAFGNIKAVCGK